MVDLAVEGKLRDAMQSHSLEPLRTKDLLSAAGKIKPSTREWFASARIMRSTAIRAAFTMTY